MHSFQKGNVFASRENPGSGVILDKPAQTPQIGADGFLVRQNDFTAPAFQVFKRNASPKDHKYAVHYVKLGISKYNAREYEEAVKNFSKALTYDDAYSRAYYYLGNAQYKLRRMTDAMCNWRLAIDSDPKSDSADKAREKLGSVNNEDIKVEVVRNPYNAR